MKTIVKITAQYTENVAFGEGGESWKPKGSANFELRVTDDYHFRYSSEIAEAAIRQLLAAQNNKVARYELDHYELLFEEPTQLSEEAFDKAFKALVPKE